MFFKLVIFSSMSTLHCCFETFDTFSNLDSEHITKRPHILDCDESRQAGSGNSVRGSAFSISALHVV